MRFTTNPGASDTVTGVLPIEVVNSTQALHRIGARTGPRDDLDQLHGRRRVEEVQADEPVGPGGGRGQFRDAQARGVRGQDGLGRAGLVQSLIERPLPVHDLGDGLYHQIGVGHLGRLLDLGDPFDLRDDLGRPLGSDLALLDRLVQALRDDPEAALDELVADVAQHDVVTGVGCHLGDAGTHRAGADYYDLLHVAAPAVYFLRMTAALLPAAPYTSDMPTLAPSTCRAPQTPLSWRTIS